MNFSKQKSQGMVDANEFCMKDMAISHLMEKDKCASKAERLVEHVFRSCKSDTAPFSKGKQRQVKTMTDII